MNAADETRSPAARPDGPPPVPPPPDPAPLGSPAGRDDHGGDHRGPTLSARLTPRLVLGLFIAGLGLVLFLEQFGYQLDPLLRWWPVALILLGAIKASQPRGRGFGIVLTVLGTVLLLDTFELLPIDEWDLLGPLFVIAIGGFLIWGALRPRRRARGSADDAATFSAFAMFGGVRRQITSRAFIGGDVSAMMGGCVIDLRRAEIAGDQAEVEVFAMWGGIELAVPDHWRVELRGMPLFGAFQDSTRPRTEDATQTLVVRGLALMGAVEVKSEPGK